MKKIFILLCFVPVLFSLGQTSVPGAFKYQGIIRDAEGDPLINDAVTLKFSVRSGGETGTIVYQETHSTATNEFGLVNLNVGQGNPIIGTFDAIAWGEAAHFLQVEVNNGGGFLNMGAYQLLSVPYALHALSAEESGIPDGTANNTLRNIGSGWVTSDFLSNDGSHVGIGTSLPSSDLHINSIKEVTGDSGLDSDIPLKLVNPTYSSGLLMDANEIQTINTPFHVNWWNDLDITLAHGGGMVRIGDAILDPDNPSLIYAKPVSGKIHTILAVNDNPDGNTRVIRGEFTGTGAYSAIGVYGRSRPQDGYGLGGFFHGGQSGLEASNYGTGDYSYYGARMISNGSNNGTNYGAYGISNYGNINIAIKGDAIDATTSCTGVSGYASTSPLNYGVYGSTNSTSAGNYGLYCNGNGAYTGTWTDVSDERFKENLSLFSGVLEGISRLNVYNYTFRNDGDAALMNLDHGTQTGFVSQELEKIFPELVRTDYNLVTLPHEGDVNSPTGYVKIEYKGINYIGMVPYLTQAIKEQQEIIEDLRLELEMLKEKVSLLENRED
jgi:hypothetical protein